MKKLIIDILAFAAVFLLLAGCEKKDSVTYSGLEAGNIDSGIFTTDNGVEMTVVGNVGKFDVTTSRRVLVEYTTNTGLDANHVEIDVHGLWDALPTPTISASALPEETADSPIQIADAWFNAGYLNVLASFEGKDVSKHQIMTAYSVSSDGITLRLYHDGSLEQTDTVQDIFACVPMDEVITSYEHQCEAIGKKKVFPAPVLLQWTWYALDEKGPVMLYERKGYYIPSTSN